MTRKPDPPTFSFGSLSLNKERISHTRESESSGNRSPVVNPPPPGSTRSSGSSTSVLANLEPTKFHGFGAPLPDQEQQAPKDKPPLFGSSRFGQTGPPLSLFGAKQQSSPFSPSPSTPYSPASNLKNDQASTPEKYQPPKGSLFAVNKPLPSLGSDAPSTAQQPHAKSGLFGSSTQSAGTSFLFGSKPVTPQTGGLGSSSGTGNSGLFAGTSGQSPATQKSPSSGKQPAVSTHPASSSLPESSPPQKHELNLFGSSLASKPVGASHPFGPAPKTPPSHSSSGKPLFSFGPPASSKAPESSAPSRQPGSLFGGPSSSKSAAASYSFSSAPASSHKGGSGGLSSNGSQQPLQQSSIFGKPSSYGSSGSSPAPPSTAKPKGVFGSSSQSSGPSSLFGSPQPTKPVYPSAGLFGSSAQGVQASSPSKDGTPSQTQPSFRFGNETPSPSPFSVTSSSAQSTPSTSQATSTIGAATTPGSVQSRPSQFSFSSPSLSPSVSSPSALRGMTPSTARTETPVPSIQAPPPVIPYDIEDEARPSHPLFTSTFQNALKDGFRIAKDTVSAIDKMRAGGLVESDTDLKKFLDDAKALQRFQGSDTRTIAVLGDSGEGKHSLFLFHISSADPER